MRSIFCVWWDRCNMKSLIFINGFLNFCPWTCFYSQIVDFIFSLLLYFLRYLRIISKLNSLFKRYMFDNKLTFSFLALIFRSGRLMKINFNICRLLIGNFAHDLWHAFLLSLLYVIRKIFELIFMILLSCKLNFPIGLM